MRYRFSAVRTTIDLGWTAVRFMWGVWVAVCWAVLMLLMMGKQLLCGDHTALFVERGEVGRMNGCGGHVGGRY